MYTVKVFESDLNVNPREEVSDISNARELAKAMLAAFSPCSVVILSKKNETLYKKTREKWANQESYSKYLKIRESIRFNESCEQALRQQA